MDEQMTAEDLLNEVRTIQKMLRRIKPVLARKHLITPGDGRTRVIERINKYFYEIAEELTEEIFRG